MQAGARHSPTNLTDHVIDVDHARERILLVANSWGLQTVWKEIPSAAFWTCCLQGDTSELRSWTVLQEENTKTNGWWLYCGMAEFFAARGWSKIVGLVAFVSPWSLFRCQVCLGNVFQQIGLCLPLHQRDFYSSDYSIFVCTLSTHTYFRFRVLRPRSWKRRYHQESWTCHYHLRPCEPPTPTALHTDQPNLLHCLQVKPLPCLCANPLQIKPLRSLGHHSSPVRGFTFGVGASIAPPEWSYSRLSDPVIPLVGAPLPSDLTICFPFCESGVAITGSSKQQLGKLEKLAFFHLERKVSCPALNPFSKLSPFQESHKCPYVFYALQEFPFYGTKFIQWNKRFF